MELSDEVKNLLSNGASSDEFFDSLEELDGTGWCMIPVYAVHYDHPIAEILYSYTSLRFMQFSKSEFNPFITAVQEGKLHYIDKFAREVCLNKKVYDNRLGDLGYGIVSDGIIEPIKLSPLDIILKRDDMDSLTMFSGNPEKRFRVWEIKALLKMCKRVGAKKCIRGLQDMLANCQSFDMDILMFDLISFASYLLYDISDLICNYIIHFHAVMVERHGAVKSRYLTENEVKLLKNVVNDEAPFHGLSNELMARVILDTCAIILNAKKCTKSKSLVTGNVIFKLTANMKAMIDDRARLSLRVVPIDTDTYMITFLKCTVTLTQMCFQHGVERRNALSGMMTDFHLDQYAELFPLEHDQSCSKILSLVCEQLRILVVSKYIETDDFLENIEWMSSPHLKSFVRTCISMMPQKLFEEYRMDVTKLQRELEEEERKNPDIQDKELINDISNIIANSSQITAIRSLQELCRVTVHEVHIPEGQLPVGQKLEIPVHVLTDLACGVTQE